MELSIVCKRAVMACAVAGLLVIPCGAFAATSSASNAASTTATAEDGASAQKADTKAGDVADDEASTVEPSDELIAWAEATPCAACHETQAEAADDETCTLSVHAPLELVCIDCHVDDTLVELHANAKPDAKLPSKLKKSDVPAEACMACHTSDALIEATARSEVLKDADGTVVNPHDLPVVKDHKKIDCDSCHKMHAASSPKNVADELCVSCHHEDVYECYTCHA